MTEVRITSETGGQKGQKPEQLHHLDPLALMYLAEVAAWGGQKYDDYNYLKGFDWSLSYDAGQRHQMLHWSGQDTDEESGFYHVAHAAWHNLCQLAFMIRGIGTDDRPKGFQREPATTPTVADLWHSVQAVAEADLILSLTPEPTAPRMVRDRDGDRWVELRDSTWYLLGEDEDPEAVLRERTDGVQDYTSIEDGYGPLTAA